MAKAEIIVIGDELTSGHIIDTNSRFLARRLNELGVKVLRITKVGDHKSTIESVIKEALNRTDLVFTTGGLGPTPDDYTKGVVAKMFKKRLLLAEDLLERIENRFKSQNKPVPPISTKQALVPKDAIILDNPIGLAPGLLIKSDRRKLFLLPGVPIELERIFEDGVRPLLEEAEEDVPTTSRIIRTTNIAESEIYERIAHYLKAKKSVEVAYLPFHTGVDIKISTGKSRRLLKSATKEIVARLRPFVYALDKTDIEQVVGEALRRKGLTIAVAESCTGGLLADTITDVPGSSDYFLGGIIVYDNKIKKELGGVKEETLKKFGAVSKETAIELAQGARKHFHADLAVATTGIAGPGGGTEKKPVGLVYTGIAAPKIMEVEEHRFFGNRLMIKEQAVMATLDLVRRTLPKL